jgi:hypothetical protein
MGAHFPFCGRADRVAVYAFFERHGLSFPLQEKYYRWWHEWAQRQVLADPHLQACKGPELERFPYGQHAFHDFHLHQYGWATALADLGAFIQGTLLPRLSAESLERLEHEHQAFLSQLKAQARAAPREPAPEVGRYRHT